MAMNVEVRQLSGPKIMIKIEEGDSPYLILNFKKGSISIQSQHHTTLSWPWEVYRLDQLELAVNLLLKHLDNPIEEVFVRATLYEELETTVLNAGYLKRGTKTSFVDKLK